MKGTDMSFDFEMVNSLFNFQHQGHDLLSEKDILSIGSQSVAKPALERHECEPEPLNEDFLLSSFGGMFACLGNDVGRQKHFEKDAKKMIPNDKTSQLKSKKRIRLNNNVDSREKAIKISREGSAKRNRIGERKQLSKPAHKSNTSTKRNNGRMQSCCNKTEKDGSPLTFSEKGTATSENSRWKVKTVDDKKKSHAEQSLLKVKKGVNESTGFEMKCVSPLSKESLSFVPRNARRENFGCKTNGQEDNCLKTTRKKVIRMPVSTTVTTNFKSTVSKNSRSRKIGSGEIKNVEKEKVINDVGDLLKGKGKGKIFRGRKLVAAVHNDGNCTDDSCELVIDEEHLNDNGRVVSVVPSKSINDAHEQKEINDSEKRSDKDINPVVSNQVVMSLEMKGNESETRLRSQNIATSNSDTDNSEILDVLLSFDDPKTCSDGQEGSSVAKKNNACVNANTRDIAVDPSRNEIYENQDETLPMVTIDLLLESSHPSSEDENPTSTETTVSSFVILSTKEKQEIQEENSPVFISSDDEEEPLINLKRKLNAVIENLSVENGPYPKNEITEKSSIDKSLNECKHELQKSNNATITSHCTKNVDSETFGSQFGKSSFSEEERLRRFDGANIISFSGPDVDGSSLDSSCDVKSSSMENFTSQADSMLSASGSLAAPNNSSLTTNVSATVLIPFHFVPNCNRAHINSESNTASTLATKGISSCLSHVVATQKESILKTSSLRSSSICPLSTESNRKIEKGQDYLSISTILGKGLESKADLLSTKSLNFQRELPCSENLECSDTDAVLCEPSQKKQRPNASCSQLISQKLSSVVSASERQVHRAIDHTFSILKDIHPSYRTENTVQFPIGSQTDVSWAIKTPVLSCLSSNEPEKSHTIWPANKSFEETGSQDAFNKSLSGSSCNEINAVGPSLLQNTIQHCNRSLICCDSKSLSCTSDCSVSRAQTNRSCTSKPERPSEILASNRNSFMSLPKNEHITSVPTDVLLSIQKQLEKLQDQVNTLQQNFNEMKSRSGGKILQNSPKPDETDHRCDDVIIENRGNDTTLTASGGRFPKICLRGIKNIIIEGGGN